ncbi:DUF4382 domain-containing protein [Shewanella psychrotolerans]|uniref:DUF4382 domain-containing protein n=1 Tax=Shewanella psychrotolerans TaxID=2864206 RepID=UPI001C65D429|nr:DUF4382 domain-containing protein [Shewanella psychrotolerans]QYK01086.1 DUF4382 domain-containing protein [Shewanella psychrotolerans]
MKYSKSIIAIALTSLLAACGGSDDKPETPKTGVFSLGVSDNPADAKVVNIAFKQVVLKGAGEPISFDVSEDGELKHVDLLTVQGQEIETLVPAQTIPVGEYQMCIFMQSDEVANENGSYVITKDDIIQGLNTNSQGTCAGIQGEVGTGRLFFNKAFTIAAGVNDFVAEFNLSKGLQAPHGSHDYWTLKPTAVQLVNNAEVGAINGQISDDVMAACEVAAGGSEFNPAVYLYPTATTLENMVDFRPDADVVEPQVAPIASARVNPITDDAENVTGYEYEFGFVAANTYSLGYTCVAQNDDPESVNTPEDVEAPFFLHIDEQDVVVTEGTTTERHFPMDFVPAT